MSKYNFKSLKVFSDSLAKLTIDRKIFFLSTFLVFFLYPGQNSLQTLIINPGRVRTYSIGAIQPSLYPQNDGVAIPYTSARAVIVQDVASKTILYERKPDSLLMPASITKVMTALVALDYWSDLESVIEVKNEDRAIGQTIELVKGERITINNILYGLLVHSGNDAALAIADNYCAPSEADGEVGSCGYSAFVDAMNQKAKDLHLEHTTFKNPSGVEQYGHLTTARDIAILASSAIQNPIIAGVVETKRIVVTDVTGQIVHDLESTNELLGLVPGLKGLKTGWTTNAGECLVSYVDRNGKKIIVVVLGSNDRFGDTRSIVEWSYNHHEWVIPAI